MSGRDIDDVLQQVGGGLAALLENDQTDVEHVALSVINRLIMRGGVGDQVLADDLLAVLRGEPLDGRPVPVDLDELSDALEAGDQFSSGGYIDTQSGAVYRDDDDSVDGSDDGIDDADIDDDSGRWLRFDNAGSRDRWEDMSDFAGRQRDEKLREQLEQAIEGKGAFRRFRDVIHPEGLAPQWEAFSTDRQRGRARAFLADAGVRAI